jgi:hypothetical protein
VPDVVFIPNRVQYERDGRAANRRDDLLRLCRQGGADGWSCKKTAQEGDLYVFYMGKPVEQIVCIGVSDGEVVEEQNDGSFDWTNAPRAWFCGFRPLVALRYPVVVSENQSHAKLRQWWHGRPFQGGPRTVPAEVVKPLLELIRRRNDSQKRLIARLADYMPSSPGSRGELKTRVRRKDPSIDDIRQVAVDAEGPPVRVPVTIRRVIRDTVRSGSLKKLYKHKCQCCGATLLTPQGGGRPYAEVHHLRPLGAEHNGNDDWRNMLVVCPTCHAKLDLLALAIDPQTLRIHEFVGSRKSKQRTLTLAAGHVPRRDSLEYHWQMYLRLKTVET